MVEPPQTHRSEKEPPEGAGRTGPGAVSRWLVRSLSWHLCFFVTANAALGLVNWLAGGPWWAFWPLLATGCLLGVHYLFCRTVAVDERWAEQRVQELNLKSYDRSHIEDLKARYGSKSTPGVDPRVDPRG